MNQLKETDIVFEEKGINIENEGLLHSQIKGWYVKPGDRMEAKVDGYIIDIIRNEELIEIQTKNFGAMKKKLTKLIKKHRVTLVHPIAEEKWIVKVSPENGDIISRRKSPAKGTAIDIFNELLRIPELINHDNFLIEVLLISMEEIRCDDGKGSWRRKGISIIDRKLLTVKESIIFKNKNDFLRLLPINFNEQFTNKALSKAMGISISKARKATYCLKKMGVLKEAGKQRNALVFELNI